MLGVIYLRNYFLIIYYLDIVNIIVLFAYYIKAISAEFVFFVSDSSENGTFGTFALVIGILETYVTW